mmetsp:Transcript_8017/g.24167  ORF Transcript_8017/g.24167 Transcript_8017/m.24167 type:complete len:261 (-) Transcript_8017:1028-1810(-)
MLTSKLAPARMSMSRGPTRGAQGNHSWPNGVSLLASKLASGCMSSGSTLMLMTSMARSSRWWMTLPIMLLCSNRIWNVSAPSLRTDPSSSGASSTMAQLRCARISFPVDMGIIFWSVFASTVRFLENSCSMRTALKGGGPFPIADEMICGMYRKSLILGVFSADAKRAHAATCTSPARNVTRMLRFCASSCSMCSNFMRSSLCTADDQWSTRSSSSSTWSNELSSDDATPVCAIIVRTPTAQQCPPDSACMKPSAPGMCG